MLRRTQPQGVGIHVVQLAGCEARWMAEGARIAVDAGADLIDINMGCPARHVTGGESGSALMRDLDHAQRLIEATIAAVRVPVILKMRLGWDERSINAPELARRAEGAGVRMITVHGRTRCQFYNGRSDWARSARGQGRGLHPGRRQRRYPHLRGCGRGACRVRRRCSDGRTWRAGPAVVSRPARALSRHQSTRGRSTARHAMASSRPSFTMRPWSTTGPTSAYGTRASTWHGVSTSRRLA